MGGAIIKYILILLVLGVAKLGYAQNVFNKAFDNANLANYSTNVLEWNHEYYLMQKIYTGFSNALEVIKLDSTGLVILKEKIIEDSNNSVRYGYAGSFQVINNSELCQLYRIHNDSALYLTFFNQDINVNRTYRYGFNFDVYPAVIKNLNDSTVLILGLTQNSNSQDLVLINTDLQGNERWRTIFGEAGKDDYGYSIELVNNEIIVGGQTFENSTTAHPHLFSFNIQGNLIFDTTYSSFGNGGSLDYHTTYGLFLSASVYVTGGQNPAIIKLNQDLSINWSRVYFKENSFSSLGKMVIRDNGIISTSGLKIVNNVVTGLFFQANQYGDSLNTKLIDHITGKRAQFHDIRPTSDGGYIMAGETHIPSQDSWIVKVNAWGCDSLPCTVSVSELPKTNNGDLTCYPNPSSGTGTVKGSFENASSTNQIKVFNSLGQLVFVKTIATKEFEIEVNLPSSGLYLVNLYQGEKLVRSLKWVVN